MLEPILSQLNDMRIILASSSKQRASLLSSMKLRFEVVPSNFEENIDPQQYTFSEFVEKTAYEKMMNVYENLKHDKRPPDVIIGVDTMVTFGGRMYGKPKTKEEAIQTITVLTQSELPNLVYTGVVVRYKNEIRKFTEVTTVHMLKLTDQEIMSYVATGEPMGKAGGYGIQGIASSFVTRIDGDVNNVIGLPLCKLSQILKELVIK